MPLPINPEAVNTFLRSAKHGKSRSASHGEQICHRIVRALYHVGDDIMLLDSQHLDGLGGLLQAMSGPFATDDQKDKIYTAIATAAGKISE